MIKPTELRYIKKTNTLLLTFEDGYSSNVTSEHLDALHLQLKSKATDLGKRNSRLTKKMLVLINLNLLAIMR